MKKAMIALLVVCALALGVLSVGKTSNCGGNSQALGQTRQIALVCNLILFEKPKKYQLSVAEFLEVDEMEGVLSLGLGVHSYWLKNEMSRDDELPIAICGQMFSNVPQPTIWNFYRKTPGFAVSYVDGRTRVMSVEEFNAFDFSGYTYLHETNPLFH